MGFMGPSQNLLTRLTPEMHAAFHSAGFWGKETIYALAKSHAASGSKRIAISDAHVSLEYHELVELADRLAHDLHTAGLKPGDRVAAWLPSRVEFAVFLLACSRNGYVFSPSLHRNHTVGEVSELLRRMKVRAFVTEEGYGADADRHDVFHDAASIVGLRRIYRLPPPAKRTVNSIGESLALTHQAATIADGVADDIVYLAFTSGTTGEPKGVLHSNNTLLSNARAIGKDWHFGPHSVSYTMSPLSHNLGFGALVLSILVGGTLVVHDLVRGASLLDKLCDIGATFVFGVPAHAMDLLAEIDLRGGATLEKLKGFRISGAAVPSVVVERLMVYGIVPQSGYGMTEACSHHYTLPDDGPDRITGTSGKACPGYEVAIFSVEDPDILLEAGQSGQIGGRGASLMLGYFDDQNATEASFNRSGWFMTGDLGQLDEYGYLRITGRIKEVIIRGGHNIHPARIEQLAMRHNAVERAAAVPVKDERMGEKVCLVVMPKPHAVIDPLDLLAHLDGAGLSKYDMPEYFLAIDEIPLGASGKIQKRALVGDIEKGALMPQPIRWKAGRDG